MPARLLRLASDEHLVELLRGGSEAAFEVLFDRHHRGVLGFCRHMVGSVEEAEDAVQHTFLAAYREIVGSSKQIRLRPWLYTIARNRCLTVLRTGSRQATGELQEPPTEHLAAEVERRHDLRALLGDVARLPDDQRAALVLSELGDLPHEDIADVLGCRREKVKALVFQARSSLIASRNARETSCAEIREQLATLSGGSLRRNDVRRHLADCEGCREFRAQVRRQRRDLALVLPVAPTVGLKASILGAGAAGGTALVAGGGGAAVAAKVVVVAALVGGGGVAAVEVKSARDEPEVRGPALIAPAPAVPRPVATGGARPAERAAGEDPVAPTKPGRRANPPNAALEKTGPRAHGRTKPLKGEKAAPPAHGRTAKPAKGEKTAPPAHGRTVKPAKAEKAPPPAYGRTVKPVKPAKADKAPKTANGPKAAAPKTAGSKALNRAAPKAAGSKAGASNRPAPKATAPSVSSLAPREIEK